MRRFIASLGALGLIVTLSGCYHTHSAGVCDCDPEEDPCYTRSPWVKHPAYLQGGPGNYAVNGNGQHAKSKTTNATTVSREVGQ